MTIIHDHIPQPWVLSPDMSVSPCPRIVGPALSFPASFLTAFSICVPHTYMLPCPLTSHLTSPSARLSPARQSSKLGYLSTLILHSSLTLIITINHAERDETCTWVTQFMQEGSSRSGACQHAPSVFWIQSPFHEYTVKNDRSVSIRQCPVAASRKQRISRHTSEAEITDPTQTAESFYQFCSGWFRFTEKFK